MMRDEEEEEGVVIIIREYDPSRDRAGTEAVDRECDVGPTGGMSLHADLLGDPVARIRHSPDYLMLVAETTSGATGGRIIVGIIRGTVKSVATGKSCPGAPAVASVGYILGLRVAPSHRRMGLALRMVRRMEAWFERMGAEYAYMATDKSNEASLRLFTVRCGYSKFRTPSLLVHPVHAHRRRVPRRAAVFRLGARDAERLYDGRFAHVEFFPADIGAVLGNQLSIGTFLAVIDDDGRWRHGEWRGAERFLASPPASWALASLWDCGGVFRLELRGASRLRAPRRPRRARWTARRGGCASRPCRTSSARSPGGSCTASAATAPTPRWPPRRCSRRSSTWRAAGRPPWPSRWRPATRSAAASRTGAASRAPRTCGA
ncbi:hypothetical protein EE612_015997 [Oryza sativa]|nr:hypothetical protein EE612_015997 [Oryza sativa]